VATSTQSINLTTPDLPVHVIAPANGWVPIRLGELWDYRELLYFLVWREVKIRYKQTALGVAWAVIQPVFTMVVFTLIFGRLAAMPSDGHPYQVWVYCALLPWQLFAFALGESSNSVVANQRLITKVYFPRLIMPIAAVCVGLVDFAVSFCVLIGLMAWYHTMPGPWFWTVPLWALLAISTALGIGLWLSALNVKYRDIRYTLPFLTQVLLFATPIAYPISKVSASLRPFYSLNPMVGVVEGFRWALLGSNGWAGMSVAISIAVVLLLLVSGLFYFRRMERTFADIV
jgi:lipopolysaccharide transport system permease protein